MWIASQPAKIIEYRLSSSSKKVGDTQTQSDSLTQISAGLPIDLDLTPETAILTLLLN
jgi:hypothetical protein